jgi:hypothetical protein
MMATFSANDAEMDPLTFYVQFQKPSPSLLLRDFGSDLQQIDASTAQFRLAPRFGQAGEYVLHVAVFDQGGGFSARAVPLLIEETDAQGDANCNGRHDDSDLTALISALFDDEALTLCEYSDANGDGAVTAADLPMLLLKVASTQFASLSLHVLVG